MNLGSFFQLNESVILLSFYILGYNQLREGSLGVERKGRNCLKRFRRFRRSRQFCRRQFFLQQSGINLRLAMNE